MEENEVDKIEGQSKVFIERVQRKLQIKKLSYQREITEKNSKKYKIIQ